MAIKPLSRAVQAPVVPINYGLIAQLNAQELESANRLEQGRQILQTTAAAQDFQMKEAIAKKHYDEYLQGEALATGAEMLLGSARAYGSEKAELNRRRNMYGTALQKDIESVKGDYSKLLPKLKQYYSMIEKDVKYGRLGEINANYEKAMKNAEEIDKIHRKGNYTDYDYNRAMSDLLTPVPESVNIGKDLNQWLNERTPETMDWNIFHDIAMNYVNTNPEMARQLDSAKASGQEYYDREIGQIESVIANNYRLAVSKNSGKKDPNQPTYIGTGHTPTSELDIGGNTINDGWWFSWGSDTDADMNKVFDRIEGNVKDKDEGINIVNTADENLRGEVLDYKKFDKSYLDRLTDEYRPTLSGSRFFELGEGNKSGEFNDFYKNLDKKEKDKFDQTFRVVGVYESNPYVENGIAATATVGEEQKYFIIDAQTDADKTSDITTMLYKDLLNKDYRKTGNTPQHTVYTATGQEVNIRALPKIKKTSDYNGNPTYKWVFDIELIGYDKNTNEQKTAIIPMTEAGIGNLKKIFNDR